MATRPNSRTASGAHDRRPILTFIATMAAITAAPIALAAYAQSRPISEAVCTTSTDTIFATGEPVSVTTCRIAGVEVSRTVRHLQQEG